MGYKKMTRRKFLVALGSFSLAVIGGYPFLKQWMTSNSSFLLPTQPTLPWNGNVRSFKFVLRRGRVQLGNGHTFDGYLINDQFPGPEIRVHEGDKVKVEVVNQLNQPTTLHWHGVNSPSGMDGVPGISRDPILHGQSFTYEFLASPSGTRWYHSHVFEMEQIPNGLFGPLVIEPKEKGDEQSIGREYTIIFSTWGYQSDTELDYGMMGGMGQMMGGGTMTSSSLDLLHLINGKDPSNLKPIELKPGEKIRLRLINASGTESYSLVLDDGDFLVTHTDGNSLKTKRTVSELYIAPAERYDIVITPYRSGTWYLRSKISGQESVRIPFHTNGKVITTQRSTSAPWTYSASTMTFHSLPAADRSFPLTLSGGMMMSNGNWTINGNSYPDARPLRVGKGERIRFEIYNMSMMEHPMHLHGHSFTITSFNGKILGEQLAKDVVNLRPMEYCTIDFEANNPGNWFFHCHNLQHMMNGLATVVEYEDYPPPHVDKWM